MTELPHLADGHLALFAPGFLFLLLFSFLQHGWKHREKRPDLPKRTAQLHSAHPKRACQRGSIGERLHTLRRNGKLALPLLLLLL